MEEKEVCSLVDTVHGAVAVGQALVAHLEHRIEVVDTSPVSTLTQTVTSLTFSWKSCLEVDPKAEMKLFRPKMLVSSAWENSPGWHDNQPLFIETWSGRELNSKVQLCNPSLWEGDVLPLLGHQEAVHVLERLEDVILSLILAGLHMEIQKKLEGLPCNRASAASRWVRPTGTCCSRS